VAILFNPGTAPQTAYYRGSIGDAAVPLPRLRPDAPSRAPSFSPYDRETGELLLGTDAVEVVVKATEARAGEVAAATENSIAEPAPSTAETCGGREVTRVPTATCHLLRCMIPHLADFVAKVPNCGATNFPPEDETSNRLRRMALPSTGGAAAMGNTNVCRDFKFGW
jgi:hypothetical protein